MKCYYVYLVCCILTWGCFSRKCNHFFRIGGSLCEKTNSHKLTAISIGRILCPLVLSRPNCKTVLQSDFWHDQHTLNVNLYRSLNISGLVANWEATSGNLDCIPLHESAFKALQPWRNSCLVNLHICSAPNCQARTERR